MKNKRVYALVTNDLNYDQRMHRICAGLQKNGYDVTLVGRKLPDSAPLIDRAFRQIRLRCFFHSGIAFYLEMNIRLIVFMLTQKVDILHAVDLDTLGAGTVVKMLKRCRLIFDAHEYFTEVPELQEQMIKKSIWTRLGLFCMRRVDAAITVSKPLQSILEEKYGMPFTLVRNFPLQRKNPISDALIAQRDNILLYQGAINQGRGVPELIKLMLKLKDWELWIVGKGDLYEDCVQLTSELNLTERVRLFGYITPDELQNITPKAMIGFNLLDGNSKNYLYSSANKFYDYIQASVPSITMDYPVYNSVLKDYKIGESVPDLDENELVSAIHAIKDNYEIYLNACRKAADVYVWEKEMAELLEIYD